MTDRFEETWTTELAQIPVWLAGTAAVPEQRAGRAGLLVSLWRGPSLAPLVLLNTQTMGAFIYAPCCLPLSSGW